MRILAALFLAAVASGALAHDGPHPSAAAATRMRVAAERVLAALPPAARDKVRGPSTTATALDWHYTPRSRNGIALKELDAQGRDAVHALLKEALSATGYRKVVNIIELELVLREMETFGLMRDPERYHLTIYGTPSATDGVGLALRRPSPVAQFHARGRPAWPSTRRASSAPTRRNVPKRPARGIARARRRGGRGARAARVALRRAAPRGRVRHAHATATSSRPTPPRSIRSRPSASPRRTLTDAQRAQLVKLVEVYARTFEPGLARSAHGSRARRRHREDPLRLGRRDRARQASTTTACRGRCSSSSTTRSQDGGNHIHTVWRDFNGDFGRDLLREHYDAAKGTAHQH